MMINALIWLIITQKTKISLRNIGANSRQKIQTIIKTTQGRSKMNRDKKNARHHQKAPSIKIRTNLKDPNTEGSSFTNHINQKENTNQMESMNNQKAQYV